MKDLLIIFIKYPEPGRVKTRLGRQIGYEQAALFYEELVKQQIRDLDGNSYDLACYVDDSHPLDQYRSKFGSDLNFFMQKGKDLGERMARAIEESFERHHERVILMGSDIPLVSGPDVTLFFNHLLTHQMVIGPAEDGGYYMIGCQKGISVVPLFENIAWSTPDVLKTTLARASGLNVRIEKTWFDIDTLEDLQLYQHLVRTGKKFPERW
ncbi:TIGR04282 family arsenosugar biosynthesis glycosyltransferase [Desulforhopalus vacuolatus]|uniref:TIGR04282 family arsenosugar biosynthesis glycosyltransferase n=1 Tax=Desulforhopalus vacuolatus TaxID=40414 RepID=UPI001962912D|nr:TIGR04282 family arsenosugar biosynthesis glycosyltransferase [Desulforhopalus vacuolatus]MBM9520754.1 TIGR04282 family arsenosugar biosynthesis glycosyltransferase [Desulforhopalus vacuolatus]